MQSVHITTILVSSNPAQGRCTRNNMWYSLSVTFPGNPVSSINKTDRHDITEILLRVALNPITLTLKQNAYKFSTAFKNILKKI